MKFPKPRAQDLARLLAGFLMVAAVVGSGRKFGLGTSWAKNRSANRREVSAAKYAARASRGASSKVALAAARPASPPPASSSTPLIPPSLNSPANGATNVGTSPTLSVTATDPNGGNVTVTFYGRQHVASPNLGPSFTIIPVSDTQYYVSSLRGGFPAMLDTQMQWIVNNRVPLNIAFVLGLGDIVQDGDNNGNPIEWQNANHSYSMLEDPVATGLPQGIPYGLDVGNHDQGSTGNGGVDSSTSFYNQYFGISRFSGRSYYGGYYGSDNNNHYELFSASGMDFLVVNLEWDENVAHPEFITWANSILQSFPNRRAIVVTHYVCDDGFNAAFSTQGQAIYNGLKGNPNFFLMLGGHYTPPEGWRQDTSNGNRVVSIHSDYQELPNGGNGWLRIMTFSPANNSVHVQTYSPTLNQFENTSAGDFTFTYPMQGPGNGFPVLGRVSVPSGATANVVWGNLSADTSYDWYATIDGPGGETTSPVWSFTTMGSPSAVSLSPTSLTFASQPINTTSSAQSVTLSNTGTGTLNINSITPSADYAETTTCGATLAPAANCTISVTFTPAAAGTFTGTITITDTASGSPHTISLTGTGTGPMVSLSPTSLTFGYQQISTTSATQSVTLRNTGNATLGITSIAPSGDFGQTNTCGTSVGAGANCTISVTFTPTATGTRTGAITITDSASGSPQTVSLTGSGATVTAPAVALNPSSVGFGNQAVNTASVTQNVTLTNSGTGTLNVTSIVPSGDYADMTTCGAMLARGATCTISVTFTPTAPGTRTGAITITDDATGSPQTVSLTGTGIAAPVYSISGTINPTSVGNGAMVTLNPTAPVPVLVQSAHGSSSTGNSSGTVSFRAPSAAGDTIVLFVRFGGTTISSVTDNQPSGSNSYGSVLGPTQWGVAPNVTDRWAQVFVAKDITGGSTLTITVSFSGGSGSTTHNTYMVAVEYSGVDPANPVSATAVGTGTVNVNGAPTTGNLTTTLTNTKLVATSWDSNESYTSTGNGSGYTTNTAAGAPSIGGGTGWANLTEDRTATTAGTWNATASSLPAVADWAIQLIALAPVPSQTVTGDANGNYSFTGLPNGSYLVTPTKTSFTFSPASRTVTVSGANATGINFVTPPSITSFTPASGPVATSVTLTGTGFTGATGVSFNGTAATTFTVNSDTQISATVPTGATSGKITVTNAAGTGTSATSFLVNSAPLISSFAPTSGPTGTSATLTGTGFTGATGVSFNSTAATTFTVNSDTQISATVPTGATSGKITVTNAAGTGTSATSFTVTVVPSITSFTPVSGPTGTSVTLTGTGFTGATGVSFNSTAATTFTVNSDTQISATVPTGATTGRIAVTNSAGTGTSAASFTVTVMVVPSITSFTPVSGPAGASVTLTGTGFTGATGVSFNGTAATTFTVNSDTQISATVPTGATTGKVTVTNSVGAGTSATNFTVTYSISGTITPAASGTGSTVTLSGVPPVLVRSARGSNFTGNSSAKATFGAASAAKDTIVLFVRFGGATISRVTDDQAGGSNTYTSVLGPTQWGAAPEATDRWAQVFVASNITGGSRLTITVTLSGSSTHDIYLAAVEYSGVDPIHPVNATAYGTGTVSIGSPVTGNLTTMVANTTLVATSWDSNESYTSTGNGTGYTTDSAADNPSLSGGSGWANLTETRSATSAGTWNATASSSPAVGQWAIQLIALAPAPLQTVTAQPDGTYTFTNVTNGSRAVTPAKAGFTFSPASRAVNVNGASVTGINFTIQ